MYLVKYKLKNLIHLSNLPNLIIFSQNNVKINISIKINIYKPRKKKILTLNQVLHLIIQLFRN